MNNDISYKQEGHVNLLSTRIDLDHSCQALYSLDQTNICFFFIRDARPRRLWSQR